VSRTKVGSLHRSHWHARFEGVRFERGHRTATVFADESAEKYGYDRLSRLIQAGYGDRRQVHYTYDPVGNREKMVEGMASAGARLRPRNSREARSNVYKVTDLDYQPT
jgi:hypothetical protein